MGKRDPNQCNPDVTDFRYWEQLVQQNPDSGNVVQYDAESPFEELRQHNTILHLVILGFYSLANPTKVVSLLLDYGANPNCQNDKGETPLHLVCQLGMRDPEIAKMLLSHGANPNILTTESKQPIDFLGNQDRYSREIRSLLEQ